MKKIKQAILFLVLIQTHSFAQVNLVPNPSFETYSQCPDNAGQLDRATPWFSPTYANGGIGASTDYLNSCSAFGFASLPTNAFGFQYAHTGLAYVGFEPFDNDLQSPGYREYLEVKLTDSLIVGKNYCISYYVSLSEISKFAIGSLGMYFSTDTLHSFGQNNDPIPVIPQVENTATNYLADTMNWMLVQGNYMAAGGERFIAIGNFRDNASTPFILGGGSSTSWAAYYYIDDISVVQCNVGVEELAEATINIIPNPATNQFTIENSQLRINSIRIDNVLGEEVLRLERIVTSEKAIDISTWKAGVYFVEVETEKGIVRKKVVKSTMY